MMINDWKEFHGVPNRKQQECVRVTLGPGGAILLNRFTYEAMEQPPAVVLLFDEGQRVIGLKPAELSHPNAFPCMPKDRSRNRVINASPFCRHYNLLPTRTILFNNVELGNDGILRLELKSTTAIGGLYRPRRAG